MKNETKPWLDLTAEELVTLRNRFLTWYKLEKRNLPWRATNDPYAIWISEIMLQQTRVETVIAYFYRFMTEFPTIADLAAAPEEKLLKVWEGLGYYSRARNLQIAAKQIMTEFNGEMPRTLTEIRSLQGIGPYTAGAIASIAFNLPEPAIDGNVLRVVSRLFCLSADIAKASSRPLFTEAVATLIDPLEPGEFNQAFMDLGSQICTPTKPQCELCPLAAFCLAKAENCQTEFPVKSKKQKPKDVYYVAEAIENDQGEFLLQQNPEQGLLAKMWLFPLREVNGTLYQHYTELGTVNSQMELDLMNVAEDQPEYLSADLANKVIWQKRPLGEITHIFSHLRWHVLLFYGRTHEVIPIENQQFRRPDQFFQLVFPKPQQKLLELLKKNGKIQ